MKSLRTSLTLAAVMLAPGLAVPVSAIAAGFGPRQYYETTWTYTPSYGYYYVHYYYLPVVTYTTYEHHYCIYYPSQPNYIYYYNPTAQVYWGRYELGSKGDKRYSLLAEKDRKKDLKEIPDKAFPKPGKMPTIPGAKDDVTIQLPPDNVPEDKPAK